MTVGDQPLLRLVPCRLFGRPELAAEIGCAQAGSCVDHRIRRPEHSLEDGCGHTQSRRRAGLRHAVPQRVLLLVGAHPGGRPLDESRRLFPGQGRLTRQDGVSRAAASAVDLEVVQRVVAPGPQ